MMLADEATAPVLSPKPTSTKINVDALIQAFVGMSQAAPKGETVAQTARKAIGLYMYLLERGIITPEGIGDGDPNSVT